MRHLTGIAFALILVGACAQNTEQGLKQGTTADVTGQTKAETAGVQGGHDLRGIECVLNQQEEGGVEACPSSQPAILDGMSGGNGQATLASARSGRGGLRVAIQHNVFNVSAGDTGLTGGAAAGGPVSGTISPAQTGTQDAKQDIRAVVESVLAAQGSLSGSSSTGDSSPANSTNTTEQSLQLYLNLLKTDPAKAAELAKILFPQPPAPAAPADAGTNGTAK